MRELVYDTVPLVIGCVCLDLLLSCFNLLFSNGERQSIPHSTVLSDGAWETYSRMFAWCGGFIKYGHWRGPTEGLEEPHKSWSVVGTCRYLVVFYGSIDTLGHLGAGCHTFYTPVRHYIDTRQISRKDRLYPIRDRTRDLPMRSLARCHSTTNSPPLAESGVA